MNKKFIKVSLIICIPLLLLIGIFAITTSSDVNYDSMNNDDILITYKEYKEDKYSYTVYVTVKNNTKQIASLNDMELSFDYKGEGNNVGEFYIKGHQEDLWDENKIMGIDPGSEKDVLFKIPKGIKISNEDYNLNRILIEYNVGFYKFRTSPNSLFLGTGGMGGTETLGEPYR